MQQHPHHDSLGNPVTLDDPGSLAAVNAFVEGFIASEARAVDVLAAQEDPSPIVQAYCAALHLFAESADAPAQALPFLQRAQAGAARATARERRFIAAVAAWADGDLARAVELHQEQGAEFPRDLASVKLGQYHAFNRGDGPAMLRLALGALPAAADVPYVHGMAAFGFEQCHRLREAEAHALHAIGMRRKEPWAHHALAHVMLTEGRLDEGLAFMQEVSDTWAGLNSFMLTHNWWHVALFLIDLGREAEALALYDGRVWGVEKAYSQDQVGAVSLLARLELAGLDVGPARWQELAGWLATRQHDQVLPFLDLQYLYGLARAGRPEADALLANIEAFAPRAPASQRETWLRVCLPAARGLVAHARGDANRAARQLDEALPRLVQIGGSHAQRDLFQQIHLDALMKTGSRADLAGAQAVLQPQVNAQPQSRRLARLADAAYAGLGLPGTSVAAT